MEPYRQKPAARTPPSSSSSSTFIPLRRRPAPPPPHRRGQARIPPELRAAAASVHRRRCRRFPRPSADPTVPRRPCVRLLRRAGLPPPALPLWPVVSSAPRQPEPRNPNLARQQTTASGSVSTMAVRRRRKEEWRCHLGPNDNWAEIANRNSSDDGFMVCSAHDI